ncbi:beta-ketoacyl synthase N-terminal-like domain-containing protein [Streptomyces sp. NPDC019224]|uniref:beta-ketoacyl synthase N-terminal-like domain-containing protein n=1 Tax=Streptomyces sp. NPDC019224 TaxID=3154484 RepID=UPI0033D2DA00
MAIAGGTEAAVTPITVAGFTQARALSWYTVDPASASRPFAADRSGFVLSEGTAVMVLESAEHAGARGARVHAVFAGAGIAADAHPITAPAADGSGQIAALQKTLAQGLGRTDGELGGDSLPHGPFRVAVRPRLGDHTDSSFAQLKQVPGRTCHDSILPNDRDPTEPGTVQSSWGVPNSSAPGPQSRAPTKTHVRSGPFPIRACPHNLDMLSLPWSSTTSTLIVSGWPGAT